MLADIITLPIHRFTPGRERDAVLRGLGAQVIGRSEQGRDILGVVIGSGPRHVSLIAGNHSDEPVGAQTLLRLSQHLHNKPDERFTFIIVPHTNPDGEEVNFRGWIDQWPDANAYQNFRGRERPGRDMEFGFPAMRQENRAVADFFKAHAPYAMHVSLHGMAACSGAWHLIHRAWVQRTAELRKRYAAAIRQAGMGLLDWDRKGEKGFWYIEPGFATTPDSVSMRDYFLARKDPDTAGKFALSSMEYVRALGGDPLCMVTELPLIVGEKPVAIDVAVRLQLTVIELGLELVTGSRR